MSVTELIRQGRLKEVQPDSTFIQQLLAKADRELTDAHEAKTPERVAEDAYFAARRAFEAVLASRGYQTNHPFGLVSALRLLLVGKARFEAGDLQFLTQAKETSTMAQSGARVPRETADVMLDWADRVVSHAKSFLATT